MKKQKTVSIKAKLLGVIIPVVIAIVVVLVVAAYQISAGTIKKYSQNLLQSSVENQVLFVTSDSFFVDSDAVMSCPVESAT